MVRDSHTVIIKMPTGTKGGHKIQTVLDQMFGELHWVNDFYMNNGANVVGNITEFYVDFVNEADAIQFKLSFP